MLQKRYLAEEVYLVVEEGRLLKKLLKISLLIIRISFAAALIASALQLFEKKQKTQKAGIYARFFKRALDVFFATGALIVFSPILAVVSIMVRIKLGSPIIFKQIRPGKNEKLFTVYKFRTMTDERDSSGELLPDEQRLTAFGKLLRSTSIDELPELINIIKGDMSIIGPRPLLVRYLPRYTEEQHHRHDVKPGLTGYAQAHGRNLVSWEEKFKMDVWYTKHVTLKTDIDILLATVKEVLRQEGISSGTSETMEEFFGTSENDL